MRRLLVAESCGEIVSLPISFFSSLFFPPLADNKHVKWLLGRDGDVSVRVIGEVDEFRSSKLLQSLMNNR